MPAEFVEVWLAGAGKQILCSGAFHCRTYVGQAAFGDGQLNEVSNFYPYPLCDFGQMIKLDGY